MPSDTEGRGDISQLLSQLDLQSTPKPTPYSQSILQINSTAESHSKDANLNPYQNPPNASSAPKGDGKPNLGAKPKKRNVRKPKPKFESSCALCDKPDSSKMVACDNCDGWYHFRCVGVNESISAREWKCRACEHLERAAKREKPQSIKSSRSHASAIALLEQQRLIEMRILEKERLLQNERDKEERILKELRDKEEHRKRETRDREYIEKLRKNEEKFMASKLSLYSGSSTSSDIGESESTSSRVSSWIDKHQLDDHRNSRKSPQRKTVLKKRHDSSMKSPKLQSTSTRTVGETRDKSNTG